MGGFIHILLVIAVVMMLVNLISGRKRLNQETVDLKN
jgi:uncharacterized membrane protein YtjA (UPF0391 family)